MTEQKLVLDRFFFLSTDGYKFKYRHDRYDRQLIHVEMFKDGEIVHKQIAYGGYGVSLTHAEVINLLEAKITLNTLDATGLKQIV